MVFSDLLSLSYPADSDSQNVFEARVARFFSYSISNMLGLVYGAFLISLVLYLKGAVISHIVIHFSFTAVIAMSVFFISKYVEKNKPSGRQLARLLLLRVVLGCAIGLLYGLACYILPEATAETGIYLLMMIYLVSISVAIFQYSVIPIYYMLFNLFMFFPLSINLLINDYEYSEVLILLLVSEVVIFFSKGIKVSVNEIKAITLNLALEKEISEHIVTQNRLEKMALYDDLTKVANRYLFKSSAEVCLERAKNKGLSMALLYIDLNDFKDINDNYGHIIGDQVLIEVAERIRKQVRSSDLVSRLGGDEFSVILEGFDVVKEKNSLINNISDTLNENVQIGDIIIELRASIGIASYPQNGNTLDELLHIADANMYKQKRVLAS